MNRFKTDSSATRRFPNSVSSSFNDYDICCTQSSGSALNDVRCDMTRTSGHLSVIFVTTGSFLGLHHAMKTRMVYATQGFLP